MLAASQRRFSQTEKMPIIRLHTFCLEEMNYVENSHFSYSQWIIISYCNILFDGVPVHCFWAGYLCSSDYDRPCDL